MPDLLAHEVAGGRATRADSPLCHATCLRTTLGRFHVTEYQVCVSILWSWERLREPSRCRSLVSTRYLIDLHRKVLARALRRRVMHRRTAQHQYLLHLKDCECILNIHLTSLSFHIPISRLRPKQVQRGRCEPRQQQCDNCCADAIKAQNVV